RRLLGEPPGAGSVVDRNADRADLARLAEVPKLAHRPLGPGGGDAEPREEKHIDLLDAEGAERLLGRVPQRAAEPADGRRDRDDQLVAVASEGGLERRLHLAAPGEVEVIHAALEGARDIRLGDAEVRGKAEAEDPFSGDVPIEEVPIHGEESLHRGYWHL